MDNSPASSSLRVPKSARELHTHDAGDAGSREGKSPAGGEVRSIVVIAFNRSQVSRTARPLRSRGHTVQSCSGVTAALDRLREGGVDLLVVERGDGNSGDGAIEFLHRVRSAGYATPSILVATPDVDLLAAAINEARVTRVVSADQNLDLLLDDILAAAETGTTELNEVESMRARCSTLEDKIDRLVSNSIQREGAARLLSDIWVEIGNANGIEEVA